MEPMTHIRALYSDETKQYRFPMEPKAGDVTEIRFRTGKDSADEVRLITGDDRYVMEKVETDGLFDYYQVTVKLEEEPFSYYFEIDMDEIVYTYNRRGVNCEKSDLYNFTIVPGFSTPDWAKGAVMYQIFVDRFYNGDPSNDV